MTCDYLVPTGSRGVPLGPDDSGECLLATGHAGDHLVKTYIGYYLWQSQQHFCTAKEAGEEEGADDLCSCDYPECYDYRNVSDAEAAELLLKASAPP